MKRTLLALLLSTKLFSMYPEASISGDLECKIFKSRVEYSYNNGDIFGKNNIEDQFLFKLLKQDDVQNLIYNTLPPNYAWNIYQLNYFIKSNDEMINFYSEGFENKKNTSKFFIPIYNEINRICDENLPKIVGKFDLFLTLGGEEIVDFLKVDKNIYRKNITGKYSYPGHFEEYINDLKYDNGVFSFNFKLKEGDAPEVLVEVIAKFIDKDNFTGVILIDGNKTELKGKRKL